jgi:hypothetical protein
MVWRMAPANFAGFFQLGILHSQLLSKKICSINRRFESRGGVQFYFNAEKVCFSAG